MRRSLVAALAAALTMLLALTAAAVADDGGRPLSTTLTGAEEAPGPGDPNATGQAELRLNQGQNEICFDISWADVDGTVFAGHIHVGPAGDPGPVVVTLFTGSFAGTDSASGCVEDVDAELIKAIRQNPTAYYVNVHSRPNFPGGAVRGQLGD
jgi:CHRD domain